MKLANVSVSLLLAAGIAAAQAPVIMSVVNNASGNIQALPNGGIAQGSVFLLVGSNMGPAALSIDHAPFTSNSLLGTSVSVTVNGTMVRMLMYYTSATQVAGLLPSNTPVGKGTVTVTYNNVTSAPAPITVVQSNFGIDTVGGTSAGVVTFPDYSVVSATPGPNCGGPNTACGAANAGDLLTIWGTGLGPVSGSDSSGAGLGVNMPNLPLKVWLGGVQITASYQGRSGCCIGIDQLVFTVPDGVPLGCAVPLAVQINDQISNYTVIAVASGSRTCAPTDPTVAGLSLQQVAGGAPITFAQIRLNRRPSNNGPGNRDNLRATFARNSVPAAFLPFALCLIDVPPIGTCIVYNNLNGPSDPPFNVLSAPDAGPSLTVNGPNGSRTLTKTPGSNPTEYFTQINAGDYLSPGAYTITGPGGADIGNFTARMNLPQQPVWTNQSSFSPVNRNSGLTVTWSGGASVLAVVIFGGSAADNSFSTGAFFACVAAGAAGTFTVPPSVLLALPVGPGLVTFEPTANPANFAASGLTLGSVTSNFDTTAVPVPFQ
jgi:uncharacterized protein (TIGR03437 family)